MFNNIWLIIVIIIILSIVFLITSFTNEKLTSITIIITISILFIFVINEFNRYNKYNYGDLLKKNCIDENTEYEDPKYHYIFNNSQIYMNQIIQFLILLFYSIILINMNISNKDKLLENNKYIIGLYGFIWTLYLILYFVFYKNESEEHKDSLLITTSVLITVLILIMLFSFIYNNYNININLAFFYFTSFFILYTIILLTLDTESHKDRINNYIWLINWSKDTDNLREIIKKLTETTGLFFIVSALIFIFIFGYIYIYNGYKFDLDNKEENKIILVILIILFILGFYAIFNVLFKNNNNTNKQNLKDLNKIFYNFIKQDEISNLNQFYNLKEDDFDRSVFFLNHSDNLFESTRTYKTSLKTIVDIREYYKSNCNAEQYPEGKRDELERFSNYIYFCEDINNENFLNEKTFDFEKKVAGTMKEMYNIDKKITSSNDLITNERINKVVDMIEEFISYIKEPKKYIIKYESTQERTGKNNFQLHRDIIENYKKITGDNTYNAYMLDDPKEYSENEDDEKEYEYFIEGKEACLFIPFYDGNIDKTIEKYDNYLIQGLSRKELKDAWIKYRKGLNETDITLNIILMFVFLFIFIYAFIIYMSNQTTNTIILVTILIILIILVFLGLNIKIIVDNIK
jgi:hypothetical protein